MNLDNKNVHIVLVDDEQAELDAYRFLLQTMGVERIVDISDSRRVLPTLEAIASPIVFLDLNMPHLSGQEVLAAIKEKRPEVPVIVCTANSEIETAVECLKLGAHDYLVKPINFNTFGSALRSALEIGYLRQEVLSLKGLSFGAGASRHLQAQQVRGGGAEQFAAAQGAHRRHRVRRLGIPADGGDGLRTQGGRGARRELGVLTEDGHHRWLAQQQVGRVPAGG